MTAISHVLTLNWTRSGEQIALNVTVSADGEVNRNVELTALQADEQVVLNIDVSALSLLYVSSDVDVTIDTNSSSEPDDTLTVTADNPLVWYTGCGLPNPFASGTDVTQVFITNGDNEAGTVKIRVLLDATP